jgi:hypothetical protein
MTNPTYPNHPEPSRHRLQLDAVRLPRISGVPDTECGWMAVAVDPATGVLHAYTFHASRPTDADFLPLLARALAGDPKIGSPRTTPAVVECDEALRFANAIHDAAAARGISLQTTRSRSPHEHGAVERFLRLVKCEFFDSIARQPAASRSTRITLAALTERLNRWARAYNRRLNTTARKHEQGHASRRGR